MSIGANPVGEPPLSAQVAAGTGSTSKPPRKRLLTAKADAVLQPEPR